MKFLKQMNEGLESKYAPVRKINTPFKESIQNRPNKRLDELFGKPKVAQAVVGHSSKGWTVEAYSENSRSEDPRGTKALAAYAKFLEDVDSGAGASGAKYSLKAFSDNGFKSLQKLTREKDPLSDAHSLEWLFKNSRFLKWCEENHYNLKESFKKKPNKRLSEAHPDDVYYDTPVRIKKASKNTQMEMTDGDKSAYKSVVGKTGRVKGTRWNPAEWGRRKGNYSYTVKMDDDDTDWTLGAGDFDILYDIKELQDDVNHSVEVFGRIPPYTQKRLKRAHCYAVEVEPGKYEVRCEKNESLKNKSNSSTRRK